MQNINDILLQSQNIYNGEITVPIVNGILRVDKTRYLVTEWRKSVDSLGGQSFTLKDKP